MANMQVTPFGSLQNGIMGTMEPSQAQRRCCVWFCSVIRGTLVGFLFQYPMEATQCCTDMWDMHMGHPALNVISDSESLVFFKTKLYPHSNGDYHENHY